MFPTLLALCFSSLFTGAVSLTCLCIPPSAGCEMNIDKMNCTGPSDVCYINLRHVDNFGSFSFVRGCWPKNEHIIIPTGSSCMYGADTWTKAFLATCECDSDMCNTFEFALGQYLKYYTGSNKQYPRPNVTTAATTEPHETSTTATTFSSSSTSGTNSNASRGLLIALVVLCVAVFIMAAVIVVVCYKRKQNTAKKVSFRRKIKSQISPAPGNHPTSASMPHNDPSNRLSTMHLSKSVQGKVKVESKRSSVKASVASKAKKSVQGKVKTGSKRSSFKASPGSNAKRGSKSSRVKNNVSKLVSNVTSKL